MSMSNTTFKRTRMQYINEQVQLINIAQTDYQTSLNDLKSYNTAQKTEIRYRNE